MRITRIETVEVVVPAHPGSWHSAEFGPPGWDEAPVTLLRAHTDTGLIGLGEVVRGVRPETVLPYARAILGVNLFSLNLQALPIGDFFDPAFGIYDALEMIVYDLIGKARGEPAYRLFGGAYRDRVEVSRCSGQMTPEDAATAGRAAVDRGYRVLKMKATDSDPLVERIAAIHAAVGSQLKVVVDPMQRFWRPTVLDRICRQLEPYIDSIECFEDPFNRANLDWYRLMRQKVRFPLALHLSYARDVVEAVKHEACDYFNIHTNMAEFHRLAAVADAAGIPVWHGSTVGFGVMEASILHVSAASRAVTLSSDVVSETIRSNDLIRDGIRIEAGHAWVPQGPGLGVDLDMDAVERYAIRRGPTLTAD